MTKPPRGQGRPLKLTARLIAEVARGIREAPREPTTEELAWRLHVSPTLVKLAIAAWTPAIEQRATQVRE